MLPHRKGSSSTFRGPDLELNGPDGLVSKRLTHGKYDAHVESNIWIASHLAHDRSAALWAKLQGLVRTMYQTELVMAR